MKWIYIIVIGFICIACPILILLYLQWMPSYVNVAFWIWLIACIASIAFSRAKKWYGRMMPSFVCTLAFTALFCTAIDTDHYMFDENNGLWVVAPTLSLPAFCFIGELFREKWQAVQEMKRQDFNRAIDKRIDDKLVEIQRLEQAVQNRSVIIHFINVLDCCGGDISQILSDSRVINIKNLASEISKCQEEIQQLQNKKL